MSGVRWYEIEDLNIKIHVGMELYMLHFFRKVQQRLIAEKRIDFLKYT